ncbi:hypothetical protein ElyMa_006414000 [Elysia marginata]|uniref:CUB domain-containing protein n=1 Tax=Elysia marginata TaxID=1093978 RepID=A0AAV4HT72_9GAST|nr:hypothetical protein ElyMa_006414000 [Elysia marginata]
MTRQMTRAMCYMNYNVIPGYACIIHIYVKPSTVSCQHPVFVNKGTAVLITCTTARVFPKGKCEFTVQAGDQTLSKYLTTTTENRNSSLYPGDQEVTCQLRVPVTGTEEGTYRFRAGVVPDIDGISYSATIFSEQIVPLELKPTALHSTTDSGHIFDFPMTGELQIDIQLTGNPPPNRISLNVGFGDNTSSLLPMPHVDYATTYNATAGSQGGVLTLVLHPAFKYGLDSVYTLKLSNGVASQSPELEYTFQVKGSQLYLNKPTCQPPVFAEEGTTAVLICMMDRFYHRGKCDFSINDKLSNNSMIEDRVTTSVENRQSTRYPGDKEVTCQLRVSVYGIHEGSFKFSLGILPDVAGVHHLATVFPDHMPQLDLWATDLFDAEENGHVFTFPKTGELHIDVQVTGNPPPNRIFLKVRHKNSVSSVPVSSLDYFTRYNSTAGSSGGVVSLVLARTLREYPDSSYNLILSNGVIGQTKCEYKFSVTASQASVQEDDQPLLFYVGLGVGVFGLLLVLLVVITFAVKKCRTVNTGADSQDGEYLDPISVEEIRRNINAAQTSGTSSGTLDEGNGNPGVYTSITSSDFRVANPSVHSSSDTEEGSTGTAMTTSLKAPYRSAGESSLDSHVRERARLNGLKYTKDIVAIEGPPGLPGRRPSACLRLNTSSSKDLMTVLALKDALESP